MSKNIVSLLGLRITKKLIRTFVDIFVSTYFFKISDSNVKLLAEFYMLYVIFIFCTMYLLKDSMRSKHRNLILQAGIALEIVYLAMFLVFKENSVNYIVLLGIIRGVSTGAYYAVYNTWEAQGITPTERFKFIGVYKVLSGLASICFPVLAGWTIEYLGYYVGFIFVIGISAVSLALSILFRDKITDTESKKLKLKEFLCQLKNEKRYKYLAACNLMNGITFSDGALNLLITLYVLRVFKTSISLGSVTTLTYLFTILLGICVGSIFKRSHKCSHYIAFVTSCLEVLSFTAMILNPTYITIPLFTLCNNIHCDLISTEENFGYNNLINKSTVLKNYTEEYILFSEVFLVISRVLGFALLILYSATDSNLVLVSFLVFVLLGTFFADRLYSVTIE